MCLASSRAQGVGVQFSTWCHLRQVNREVTLTTKQVHTTAESPGSSGLRACLWLGALWAENLPGEQSAQKVGFWRQTSQAPRGEL